MRLFLILILLTSTSAFADDGCVLNASGIKPLIIKKSLTKYSAWDNERKELRSVLTNGDMLYVKYYACEHYGLNAQLIIPMFEWTKANLENKTDWLANLALNKNDAALVNTALKKHGDVHVGDKIQIDGTSYDEFELDISADNNLTIITIEYYSS